MKSQRMVLISISTLMILSVPSVTGKDFWEEAFEKWNRNQVTEMISNSPWAKNQTLSSPVLRELDVAGGAGLSRGSGSQGEKEIFRKLTVRFFSARPVREAYVRMMQFMNRYDQMTPEERKEFDARFSRVLNLDLSDRVIISVEFACNDPETDREMKQFFDLARTATLKQNVYLISQRLGRVELREYFPPSADGTGAKFVFPREVGGKPVIDPSDREARFEFYVAPVDHKYSIEFKVKKLFYRGELTY